MPLTRGPGDFARQRAAGTGGKKSEAAVRGELDLAELERLQREQALRDSLGGGALAIDPGRDMPATILSSAVAEAPIPEPLILPVKTKPVIPLPDFEDPLARARKKRGLAARRGGLGDTILSEKLGG